MNNWYEARVRYTKQLDNGAFKRVNEPYLVSAMSFTDAEARMYEELGTIIRGEFKITSCKPVNYDDVIAYSDVDYWFEGKLKMNISEGEKPKLVTKKVLLSACNIKDAFDNLIETSRQYVTDVEIVGISKSSIYDVFPFKEEEEKEHIELKDEVTDVEFESEEEKYTSPIDSLNLSLFQVESIVGSWYTRANKKGIGVVDIFQTNNGTDLEEIFINVDYNVIDELNLDEKQVLSIVLDWYNNNHLKDDEIECGFEFYNEDGEDLSYFIETILEKNKTTN